MPVALARCLRRRVPSTVLLLASPAFMANNTTPPIAAARPEHHGDNCYKNPWPSFKPNSRFDVLKWMLNRDTATTRANIAKEEIPHLVPINWAKVKGEEAPKATDSVIQATWMGHACFLVQMNGFNILFDPVFSDRCSPIPFAGPKRYTQIPCQLSELPKIDIVVISHNHYDHLDTDTIKFLSRDSTTRFYVPLGNKAWFEDLGIQTAEELDWWEERVVRSSDDARSVKVTCTPCQHWSGRWMTDSFKTLWASWVVQSLDGSGGNIYFAGDTGYRTVPIGVINEQEHDEAYLSELPHCPAFKEIGERLGPFDFAMIPIGAYKPRWFMSPQHCSPEDAVRVHEDIRSKRSIGMHWGTWILTEEEILEPPRRLLAALKNRGHSESQFGVVNIGETIQISAETR